MHTGGCNARARPSGKGATTPTAPPTTLRCVGATAQEGATARSRTPHHAAAGTAYATGWRSEEHTSELQSRSDLVCRLLLEKKKKIQKSIQQTVKPDTFEMVTLWLQELMTKVLTEAEEKVCAN